MAAILALDLGTGSARAALVAEDGKIKCLHSSALDVENPHHGWIEQKPESWWAAIQRCIAQLLNDPEVDASSISAVGCCAQMHAVVPIQPNGSLGFESVALWNDKRAFKLVDEFEARRDADKLLKVACNPATVAWPAFKLTWYTQEFRALMDVYNEFLLPKDFINFKLTGEKAIDRSEAGSSFLLDTAQETWSEALCSAFGVNISNLQQIKPPNSILGHVTRSAAEQTGLREGLPVIVGAGDYPAALLGSGIIRKGQVSDITGTSFLLTSMRSEPSLSNKTMNVADTGSLWGAFAVVDAAGDSVRWARHFLNDRGTSYEAILADARSIPPGSDGLLYLPYLTGERLGAGKHLTGHVMNLTAGHTSKHLHRAVMEGVTFAMRHNAQEILISEFANGEIISAGGGSRAKLWNEIKANIFNRPIKPTVEAEAGLIGVACLAFSALDQEVNPYEVAGKLVRYGALVEPNKENIELYSERFAAFLEARSSVLNLEI